MEAEKPPSPVFCSADNGLLHIHVLRTLYPDRSNITEGPLSYPSPLRFRASS